MVNVMAYIYNMGLGGVECDMCGELIDAYLSLEEYESSYKQEENICWRCLNGVKDDKDDKNDKNNIFRKIFKK